MNEMKNFILEHSKKKEKRFYSCQVFYKVFNIDPKKKVNEQNIYLQPFKREAKKRSLMNENVDLKYVRFSEECKAFRTLSMI